MFPFSLDGSIKVPRQASLSCRAIEDEVSSALFMKGIAVEELPDGGISFRVAALRLLGWTFLQGVSSGTVRCTEEGDALNLSYRLRFTHLALLVTAVLLLCRELERRFSPLPLSGDWYLTVWLWLVCGNIPCILLEFRRFLRGSVEEASRRVFFWRKLRQGDADGACREVLSPPTGEERP